MIADRRGFSLIELLVVLVILGLTASVALPNMVRLYDSYKKSTDWANLVDQVNNLGVKAYQSGSSFVLVSNAENLRKNIDGVDLEPPSGWTYQVERPVEYKSNGVCLGGELRFFYKKVFYSNKKLAPPHCQIINHEST